MEWMMIYALLGGVTGFLAGFLGVGGGGILVPLLAMLFSHQPFGAEHALHLALGTAFACMVVSSAASMRAHAAKGGVAWRVFWRMAPGVMLGTFVVGRFSGQIPAQYIAVFFSGFMGLVAVQMFMNWKPKPATRPMRPASVFAAGVGIGFVSALAAVGGGFLVVMYLTHKNLEMKKAIGTSASIGFPISVAGVAGYVLGGAGALNAPHTVGFVYVPAFLMIAAVSAIAAPYGATFAHRLLEARLKKLFALLCVALGVKMLCSLL